MIPALQSKVPPLGHRLRDARPFLVANVENPRRRFQPQLLAIISTKSHFLWGLRSVELIRFVLIFLQDARYRRNGALTGWRLHILKGLR